MLPAVVQGLVGSVDEIAELLFVYDGKLAAERKWIEANAYDEEAVAAFIEVLKLTYPITALWGMVSGSRAQQTSTSSVSAQWGVEWPSARFGTTEENADLLIDSYIRRQRWLAREQAIAQLMVTAEAHAASKR